MTEQLTDIEKSRSLLIEEIQMQMKLINKVNHMVRSVKKNGVVDASFATDINNILELSKTYEERVQLVLR